MTRGLSSLAQPALTLLCEASSDEAFVAFVLSFTFDCQPFIQKHWYYIVVLIISLSIRMASVLMFICFMNNYLYITSLPHLHLYSFQRSFLDAYHVRSNV